MQIPSRISLRSGNLADFTAQITCFFWFEPVKMLETAEKGAPVASRMPNYPSSENAVPIPNFKKWVHTVLSTTQVTQNVVLLALLFIYRLKMANPTVKGRPGSEYRLLTVALMLGNKFLDDNTYTNKTWAEVSGISVGEIHVMEVEFLSNMRYSLLVSKEQWEEWLDKLAKFWEFCTRAQPPSASPLAIPSPTVYHNNNFASPVLSPTGHTMHLVPGGYAAQRHTQCHSPSHDGFPSSGTQTWQSAYQAASAVSPLALKPDSQSLRKRGLPDDDLTEPPPKRISRQLTQPQLAQPSKLASDAPHQLLARPLARPSLPAPSTGFNSGPTGALQQQQHPTVPASYPPQSSAMLSLPPLVPGIRAMSTVYPAATTTFAPQLPTLVTSGPQMTASSIPTVTPTGSYPPTAYGTPTKRRSPQSALTPVTAGYASSPLADTFPSHSIGSLGGMGTSSGVHTPISHSPSVYLQQRPSPYKPVRHVNTLLYPPPSAFLERYHFSNAVPPNQMHYQPLGRRNEYRTGIVPEFTAPGPGSFVPGRSQTDSGNMVHAMPQLDANHGARAQSRLGHFGSTVPRDHFTSGH
ncbi:hypothetical protein VTK73DRAFT_9862 [Phialemonium thermophilum]|uniref:Cyclin n=1 Tax=Phialemonium thermophilum TaxID=223376 RepID=A0ABR3XJ38_9PEZI